MTDEVHRKPMSHQRLDYMKAKNSNLGVDAYCPAS